MIFEGKFKSIDNKYVYYLKIGDTGITRQIQDGNIDAYNDGEDNKQKEKHTRDLVFGLLDCSLIMFLFLPNVSFPH